MSLPRDLSWLRSSTCADTSCIEVAAGDDEIYVRGEDGAVLRFTRDEWVAFREGVKLGDFDAI